MTVGVVQESTTPVTNAGALVNTYTLVLAGVGATSTLIVCHFESPETGATTVGHVTGTPVDGDLLMIRLTDDGTGRAITWGTSFEASTVALPATTVISAMLTVGFEWNTATSKWRCIAVA